MTIPHPSSSVLWPRAQFSPGFVKLWRQMVLALAVFHLVAQLVYWLPLELARTDKERDVTVYFDAVQRLKHGLDLYQPWPDYGVQMTPSHFFYSPAFMVFTRPLSGLSYWPFVHVWLVLILVASWVYAFCLSRLATGRWNWKCALVFGLVLDVVAQGHTALSIGQFEPFMWMMFGLALTTRNRAGWLALATLVKVHPVWALGLVLVEGKKAAWKNAALFAIPVLLLSWWLVGTHNWAMWWPSAQPVASQGTFSSGNWSLSFALLRVLSTLGALSPFGTLPLWARAYLSLCGVGAPLGAMYLARHQSPNLRLTLVAATGVLFSPLCWTAYYPLLLLPFSVWLGEKKQLDIKATEAYL